jgi:hypothetical protein
LSSGKFSATEGDEGLAGWFMEDMALVLPLWLAEDDRVADFLCRVRMNR